MKDLKKLLEVRARAKAKKPTFRRQDWHIRKKFGEMWRQPRGQHSKMRLKVAGRGALVKPGYRSPRLVRGMSKDGKQIVHVESIHGIEKIDSKKQTVIIGATVGARKRLVLLKLVMQRGITVYNVKNPEESVKQIESSFNERKKKKKETLKEEKDVKKDEQEAKKSKKESQKKDEEKKESKEEQAEDEKESQRREAEKIMIQK